MGSERVVRVLLSSAGVGVLHVQVHPAKWSLDPASLWARAGRSKAQQRQVNEEDVVSWSISSVYVLIRWGLVRQYTAVSVLRVLERAHLDRRRGREAAGAQWVHILSRCSASLFVHMHHALTLLG